MLPLELIGSVIIFISATFAAEFDFLRDKNVGFYESFNPYLDVIAAHKLMRKSDDKEAEHNSHKKYYYIKDSANEEKGGKSNEDHEFAKHGEKKKETERSKFLEGSGQFNDFKDGAENSSKQHLGKSSHKGAKFAEKKGHKRGHKTKGYHNKFFKDEYHKERRFYDDHHKSGEFSKYGKAHSKFNNASGDNKSEKNHKANHYKGNNGKKGYNVKENNSDDHFGFNSKKGDQQYYNYKDINGKNVATSRGQHYGYKQE